MRLQKYRRDVASCGAGTMNIAAGMSADVESLGVLNKEKVRFGRQGKRRRIEQGLLQEDDGDDARSDGGFTEDGSFGTDLGLSDGTAAIDIDEDFSHFFCAINDGEVKKIPSELFQKHLF